jgi:gas vesicle protein
MRDQRRRGGAFRTIAAFGLGAATGSILALLYAPASGKVTRRKLALRAQNLKRTAIRRFGQTQRALAVRAENVREAATEWITDHMPHGNGGHRVRRREVRHA